MRGISLWLSCDCSTSGGKVSDLNQRTVAENHGSLNDVFKLTNIPSPRVVVEQRQGCIVKAFDVLVVFFGILREKVGRQRSDVSGSFGEAWKPSN